MEKNIFQIKYDIDALVKEKEKIKRTMCESKIKENAILIFEQNKQSPLSQRELESILVAFYFDIRNITEE